MISGIILASGFSRRMKREKLTLAVEGIPMLERVIRSALASALGEVLLVYQKDEIRELGEKHGLKVIRNLHPEYGQSAAVRLGVTSAHPKSKGFMFLVGDQPYLSHDTVNRLIFFFNTDISRIVAPTYNGKRGNPVIFPASLKAELLMLEGDQGGRSLMDTMPHLISLVTIPDETEAMDVDTIDEYEKFRQ